MTVDDRLPETICKECIRNVNFAYNFRTVIINNDLDLRERLNHFNTNANNIETVTCKSLKFEIIHLSDDTNGEEPDNFSDESNDALEITERLSGKTDQEKLRTCESCNFSTLIYTEWNNHLRSDAHLTSSNKLRKCRGCDFKTRDYRKLRQHRNHHVKKGVCNFALSTTSGGKRLHRCEPCDFGTPVLLEWKKHTKSSGHLTEIDRLRKCDGCNFLTRNYERMRRHEMLYVKFGVCTFSKSTSKQGEEKNRRCKMCDYSTWDCVEWKRHLRSGGHLTNTNRVRVCEGCDFTTTDYFEWNRHRRRYIRDGICTIADKLSVTEKEMIDEKYKSEEQLKCNLCEFTTMDWRAWRRHRNQHLSMSRTRECKRCNFSANNLDDWRDHQKTHVNMCVCAVCGKSVHQWNIAKHLISHTTDPVSCEKCGRVFKNSESLRTHKRIHRELAFKCDECDKVYKHRAMLFHHKQKQHVSSEEAKQQCTLCDKRFYGNEAMKRHMRVHTGERPFPCPQCPRRLSSKYALKTHQRQHTKEKPFVCEYCAMAFAQRVSLRTHIASKHPMCNGSKTVQAGNSN